MSILAQPHENNKTTQVFSADNRSFLLWALSGDRNIFWPLHWLSCSASFTCRWSGCLLQTLREPSSVHMCPCTAHVVSCGLLRCILYNVKHACSYATRIRRSSKSDSPLLKPLPPFSKPADFKSSSLATVTSPPRERVCLVGHEKPQSSWSAASWAFNFQPARFIFAGSSVDSYHESTDNLLATAQSRCFAKGGFEMDPVGLLG